MKIANTCKTCGKTTCNVTLMCNGCEHIKKVCESNRRQGYDVPATPTDTIMENIAVLDLLTREGYSDRIIDRIETAVNCHEELTQALKGMVEWARRVEGANPGMEVANAISALAKAERGE